MKKLSFLLLLILVLEITISVDSQNPSLLKFVLQWPPTFCININSATPPGRCKEPIPQHSFTLHGVWPADQNGKSLTCPQPPDPNWNQLVLTRVYVSCTDDMDYLYFDILTLFYYDILLIPFDLTQS